jgi:hypothetical protein
MKNILKENMIRFGTKNLSEQFFKNVVDKVKGVVSPGTDNNICKGVTVTNPPAHFKTKYVNNATDLYFYGVTSFEDEGSGIDGNYISKNTQKNHTDCYKNAQMNLLNSLLSKEQPKPIGAIPKQGAIVGSARGLVLADSVNCLDRKNKIVILWRVYTISVDNYNRILQRSGPEYSDGIVGTVPAATTPAAAAPTVSTPTTTPVAPKTVPVGTTTTTPAATTTPATTSATPTTTAVPTKATHMYPNDKNYLYAKDAAGKWWAQNKKTSKWFDISTKYPGSVANLEKGAKLIQ